MGYYYNYGPYQMFNFGWVLVVIFWLLIIWGIIALIKMAAYKGHYHGHMMSMKNDSETKREDRSLSILKERYAKGEINKDEYEDRKKVLMS